MRSRIGLGKLSSCWWSNHRYRFRPTRDALSATIAWWDCPNHDALNVVELSIRRIIKRF
jgi:hypothetical protein